MKILLEEARKLQDTMVKHRRQIHENAEVHNELPLTTAYVMSKLNKMGYEPKEICKSGILAIAGGKKPGTTFLLRADMDALPIVEENNLDFKSKTENMHACGHDMHTAMLLGAAQLLKDHEGEIEGQVKLMFQPAEETLWGAKTMVEAGVLENPKVDAAMMIHVFAGVPAPSGTVMVFPAGISSAASDWFTVKIQGKGGHGAMPNTTIDPLNVAAHIHIALQGVNAREVDPAETAVLTIGQIHGGNTSNVIPDTAFLSGTIRSFSKETREFIKKRLEEISKGIASTFRASATVEYPFGCPSVINDKDLREQIIDISSKLIGKEQVLDLGTALEGSYAKLSGSEDFGYVSELVPSAMVILGGGSPEEGYNHPMHHPKVSFNEEVLHVGAAVYANTAIEWLKNNN